MRLKKTLFLKIQFNIFMAAKAFFFFCYLVSYFAVDIFPLVLLNNSACGIKRWSDENLQSDWNLFCFLFAKYNLTDKCFTN